MLLSDKSIKEALQTKRIIIDPWDEALLQPASVDLRLGKKLRIFRNSTVPFIDVKQELPELTEIVEIDEVNPFYLHPAEFALGVILEKVCLPGISRPDSTARVPWAGSAFWYILRRAGSTPAGEDILPSS